ncbi:MAG TPA: hypothetical protein VGH54_21455 [Mycobacterium sp.]|uniref:hypothetical protein n=1 Tax=Mycobacterium sp. TaxID=1785 RepID=UPI002F3E8680
MNGVARRVQWTEFDRRNAPRWGVDLDAEAPAGCDPGRRLIRWTPRACRIGTFFLMLAMIVAFYALLIFCLWLATYHRGWTLPFSIAIVLTFATVAIASRLRGRAR